MSLDKTQWTTRRNTNMRHGVSKNNILKIHGGDIAHFQVRAGGGGGSGGLHCAHFLV